jgi:hypothetical protein
MLVGFSCAVAGLIWPRASAGDQTKNAAAAKPIVFLGGGLSDEQTILFTTTIAASGQPAIVLLDGPKAGPYLKEFIAAYHPERIIPVGSFTEEKQDLDQRLGVTTAPIVPWKRGPPDELWKILFPKAERLVLCPAEPRELLLQSACLAGALRAPLYINQGDDGESDALRRRVTAWGTKEIFAAADAEKLCRGLSNVHVAPLRDHEAVAREHVRRLLDKAAVHTIVLANPSDVRLGLGEMSPLAPWLAIERHAPLLLTNDEGENAEALVESAEPLQADTMILVAGLKAIPMRRRPNPVAGKDVEIVMEPMTPRGEQTFSYATGRLFHEDPAVVPLMLARQRLLDMPAGQPTPPRKALIVSNPGGGLPLLETFSRNTAREFRNRGYETIAMFEDDVNKESVRRLVPKQDIFLWEGHYRTLIDEYGLPNWTEPLRPSLVFLQSCLALNEAEAQPLLQRGAMSVIGSPVRMYSASGGSFTLAFFDAMLYDGQTLGGALRQAKNFLLTYSLLKEKRLGEGAKLGGANLRSAWAFTLWGDPALKLPEPTPPAEPMPAVRPEVHGRTIVFSLPPTSYEKVTSEKYEAQMLPNSRLAGLLGPEKPDGKRSLVPFIFAEIHLPTAPAGKTPVLHSRLPGNHWVFCYDRRRRCGYLLVTPRPRDEKEIRFHIEWEG